jgi:acyl dehydratase
LQNCAVGCEFPGAEQARPVLMRGSDACIVASTMDVPFDPRRLMARQFAPISHSYRAADVQLYALGLGFGMDPLDQAALAFAYEGASGGSLQVVPTFANVLAYPGFWAREPDTGIDWKRLVHAEQEIVLHARLPASGDVTGHNRVTAVWDRGEGRGAFMQQQREVRDSASGALLAKVTQLTLMRGNGGFGPGASEGAPPRAHAVPERAADVSCDLPSSAQAALIYRLSGDRNPLHADPEVAQAAGFQRPILHGMATMGVAAHAVLRAMLGYDTSAIARMKVRFSAPAFPGETFRTEMWKDGSSISFRTTALERGVVVLDNGLVQLN